MLCRALYCYISVVSLSVRPSVTLTYRGHVQSVTSKVITRRTSRIFALCSPYHQRMTAIQCKGVEGTITAVLWHCRHRYQRPHVGILSVLFKWLLSGSTVGLLVHFSDYKLHNAGQERWFNVSVDIGDFSCCNNCVHFSVLAILNWSTERICTWNDGCTVVVRH